MISLAARGGFPEVGAPEVATASRVQSGGLRQLTTVDGDLIESGAFAGMAFCTGIARLGEAGQRVDWTLHVAIPGAVPLRYERGAHESASQGGSGDLHKRRPRDWSVFDRNGPAQFRNPPVYTVS